MREDSIQCLLIKGLGTCLDDPLFLLFDLLMDLLMRVEKRGKMLANVSGNIMDLFSNGLVLFVEGAPFLDRTNRRVRKSEKGKWVNLSVLSDN